MDIMGKSYMLITFESKILKAADEKSFLGSHEITVHRKGM